MSGLIATPPVTVEEARRILGTTAQELADDDIKRLISQIDLLTDIVVSNFDGSKIHTSIEKYNHKSNTKL